MDKVYCPWCGSEMKLEEALPYCCVYAYVCECGAVSPSECGEEEAYAVAIRRPLQKPLTLKEAQKNPTVIYYEHKTHTGANGYGVFDKFRERYQMEDGSILPMLSKHVRCNSVYYGAFLKDWRCWATKPSDEEREAAKWE